MAHNGRHGDGRHGKWYLGTARGPGGSKLLGAGLE